MSRVVYFIKPIGLPGPIKIGSTCEPIGRLSQLADWSPWPLEILVTVPGSFDLERQLHGCFAHAHKHREWFNADPELVAGIAALLEGVPVGEAFDLLKRTGSIRKKPANYGTSKSPQYRQWWRYLCQLRHAQKACGRIAPTEIQNILCASRREVSFTENEKSRLEQTIAALKKLSRKNQANISPSEKAGLEEVLAEPKKNSTLWRQV